MQGHDARTTISIGDDPPATRTRLMRGTLPHVLAPALGTTN